MTQPIHLRAKYWAAEVPLGSFSHFVNDKGRLQFHKATNFDSVPLPPGNWKLICTTQECTWERTYELVEHYGDGFKDYEFDGGVPHSSPVESFHSLLRSKGLDADKSNYAILKKQ